MMTPYSGKIAENCLTGSLGNCEKPCPTCDGGKNVVEDYLACPTCDATGVVDSSTTYPVLPGTATAIFPYALKPAEEVK